LEQPGLARPPAAKSSTERDETTEIIARPSRETGQSSEEQAPAPAVRDNRARILAAGLVGILLFVAALLGARGWLWPSPRPGAAALGAESSPTQADRHENGRRAHGEVPPAPETKAGLAGLAGRRPTGRVTVSPVTSPAGSSTASSGRLASREAPQDTVNQQSPALAGSPSAAPAAEDRRATPAPQMAELRLLVEPWADVTVDDKLVGQTPLRALSLPPGVHVVQLSHPDFWPLQRKVTLRPGETLRMEVNLREEAFPIRPRKE
jgi:hypothetical protein